MTDQFELPTSRLCVLVTDHLAQRGVELIRMAPGFAVVVEDPVELLLHPASAPAASTSASARTMPKCRAVRL
jgi:hypothetical protein